MDDRHHLHLNLVGLGVFGGGDRPVLPPCGGVAHRSWDGDRVGHTCADNGDHPAQPENRADAPLRSWQPVRESKVPTTAETHGMVCSMSRTGNCWESEARRWLQCADGGLLQQPEVGMVDWKCDPPRVAAVGDVRACIAYYNSDHLHTTLGDLAPIEFEQCA